MLPIKQAHRCHLKAGNTFLSQHLLHPKLACIITLKPRSLHRSLEARGRNNIFIPNRLGDMGCSPWPQPIRHFQIVLNRIMELCLSFLYVVKISLSLDCGSVTASLMRSPKLRQLPELRYLCSSRIVEEMHRTAV